MPLKSGSSNKTKSSNIKEIMKSYKETGKIGTSTPETKEKARKQAVAIAYSEADKSKKKKKKPINEALESFIDSFKTPANEFFLESIVKHGLHVCFEATMEEPINVFGRTLQYDAPVGKYYDPSTDTYLEHDEYDSLRKSDDDAQQKFKRLMKLAVQKSTSPKEINKFINGSHLHWNQDSARELEKQAMQIVGNPVFEDATISQDNTSSTDTKTVLDTNKLSSNEIDVMQTELDKVKMQKAEIEKKNTDLAKTQQDLQKTTQAMTLNNDANRTI
jgi:hypothetical protein